MYVQLRREGQCQQDACTRMSVPTPAPKEVRVGDENAVLLGPQHLCTHLVLWSRLQLLSAASHAVCVRAARPGTRDSCRHDKYSPLGVLLDPLPLYLEPLTSLSTLALGGAHPLRPVHLS